MTFTRDELLRYYASDQWAAKRRECWETYQWRCSVCDYDYRGKCPLQCHHLPGGYKFLGRENVRLHLRPLCRNHHPKGRLTLDGIRLSRSAYRWRKRIVWTARVLWRGLRWLAKRLPHRPTAA